MIFHKIWWTGFEAVTFICVVRAVASLRQNIILGYQIRSIVIVLVPREIKSLYGCILE